MTHNGRSLLGGYILFGVLLLTAVGVGIFVGLSGAMGRNIGTFEDFNATEAALPTQIFDIKGRKITEFFSVEKRELVKVNELPPHLIHALLTREDQDFFQHKGFSIKGFARAAFGVLTGRNLGGGSTITQQLAGHLYADRTDRSYTRKIRELWYAIQLEKQWTKQQILEEYMNKMYLGHGTYGVEAASKFYFGHSAREITLAESAILVIQLAGTSLYSPLRNTARAQRMQREILDQMVDLGFVTAEAADTSFNEYWETFDYTKSPDSTVFYSRQDLAPYFSEHVRNELVNQWLLGGADINRDGYKVYTTLNLDHQAVADRLMNKGIAQVNQTFRANQDNKGQAGADSFVPLIDALALMFDIGSMRVGDRKQVADARDYYFESVVPVIELMGLTFLTPSDPSLVTLALESRKKTLDNQKRNTVEGALIAIDNETGYITAMVGGSGFQQNNQLNRAMQGKLQPGSAFKPLYYAAAIETNTATAATRYYDSPVEFTNDDGSKYSPMNYNGVWEGPVLVRHALMRSMNIPSIKLLNDVGFDDAIRYSSRLMDIPQNELNARNFTRRYPLGLGIVAVSPLEVAKGYSAFPRLGRQNKEITIRLIQDRAGRTVVEPEREIRQRTLAAGGYAQVISPQSAFIMADMLTSTVREGTLASSVNQVRGLPMPMGGKTGTTQNWADAWAVGFSAYYTTAVWFGFDEGGGRNSLGTNQTGARAAGPIWAEFMKTIHQGLEAKRLPNPGSGLVWVDVVARSGLLPPPDYKGPIRREVFKVGTEPREIDLEVGKETWLEDTRVDLPALMNWENVESLLDLDPEVQRILESYSSGVPRSPGSLEDPLTSAPGGYGEILPPITDPAATGGTLPAPVVPAPATPTTVAPLPATPTPTTPESGAGL